MGRFRGHYDVSRLMPRRAATAYVPQTTTLPIGDLPGWTQIVADDFNYTYPIGSIASDNNGELLSNCAAYAELHDICKHPANNCHIEYASEYLRAKNSVVSYVVIDTSKPYSAPHLPVGENAAPSTIFHNEYTDDEVTEYDDDGIPIPPSLYNRRDDATQAPVSVAETMHITAPKVTFKRATA